MQIQTINFDRSGMYRSTYKNELNVREHIHQCTEIIYVTDGEITVNVGGEEKVLGRGDAALIPPFISHSFITPRSVRLWLCVFSNDLLSDFLPREDLYRTRSTAYFKISERLAAFLDGALPDSDEEMVAFGYTERRRIMSVLFPIINEYMDSSEPLLKKNTKPSLLSEILLYLDKHYAEPLTITDVSKALGYTPRHISRQLSELGGYNFRSLLNNFRIEHAKLMIRRTDAKLIDIAMEFGFVSERTFFRAFLKSEGMTPNEYRVTVSGR